RHDVLASERALIAGKRDEVGEAIEALRRAGFVFEGRLPPPKGAPIEDWEDREQTLFRATEFGDDVDRPLKKSDGSYTYFASDIAYHKSKLDRGFPNMIDVWGADHGGYIKRMQAAVKAVARISNAPAAELDVKIVQLVRLLRAARECIPDLPADAAARAAALAQAPLERLDDPGEIGLMRRLALYPRLVEAAAMAHEPHRIAFYLYDLASDFHAHWNRGKDLP